MNRQTRIDIRVGMRRLCAVRLFGVVRCALLLTCVVALTLASAARANPWTVSVDERNGLPTIAIGGATAMTPEFVFWGQNWSWAGTMPTFRVVGPFDYAMTAQNTALGLDLRASIRKQSEQHTLR